MKKTKKNYDWATANITMVCSHCEGSGYIEFGPSCSQPVSNCCGGCYIQECCNKCNGSEIQEIEIELENVSEDDMLVVFESTSSYYDKFYDTLYEKVCPTLVTLQEPFKYNDIDYYSITIKNFPELRDILKNYQDYASNWQTLHNCI